MNLQIALAPWQIGLIVVVMTLYAIAISWGPIRKLDDDPEWRWMITAVGVAMVIAIATWQTQVHTLDLFIAFGVATPPMWVRSAIIHYASEDRRAIREAGREPH